MNDIITVKDLRLWYGQTQALKGVSMDIPEKSIRPSSAPPAAANRRSSRRSTA